MAGSGRQSRFFGPRSLCYCRGFDERRRSAVNVMRFWSDLSMWNKYGLAAVGGIAIAALLAWLLV